MLTYVTIFSVKDSSILTFVNLNGCASYVNKEEFALRLKNACAAVVAAQDELTEIDSHFGDADHGVTMTKIAEAISGSVSSAGGGIKAGAVRPERL